MERRGVLPTTQLAYWKGLDTCDAETARRYFSKVILESNVTPNITRSSDSFSTVPPIVNMGDWGCIGRDLETIIVLILHAFNFIPQRSHNLLTFMRSQLRDSATATLRSGDGTTAINRHNRSAYSPKWKNAPRCIGGTIMASKHCPAALLT